MDIQFRLIRADELSNLLDLYEHLNSDEPPLPEEDVLHRVWDDFLTDPKIFCVVGETEGRLVASCTLIIIPNLTRGAHPYGLIENVVTHSDYRKKRIRKQLAALYTQPGLGEAMLQSDVVDRPKTGRDAPFLREGRLQTWNQDRFCCKT
jgi:hypothetical protein